jgi:hypothetical protein
MNFVQDDVELNIPVGQTSGGRPDVCQTDIRPWQAINQTDSPPDNSYSIQTDSTRQTVGQTSDIRPGRLTSQYGRQSTRKTVGQADHLDTQSTLRIG